MAVNDSDQSTLPLDPPDDHSKQKSKQPSASKSKDLSHVPCKFFRVGSCTAGASCPFSHASAAPAGTPGAGAQKDTCAWFVKGNCKFGHKCALAHILPGQSMAMDRKNKKAAQVAAAAQNQAAPAGGAGNRGGKGARVAKEQVGGAGRGNPLLSGSTAPTRRMPMPTLKATISPSAPAPPVKDTDFASFGMDVEDANIAALPSAPALPQPTPAEGPSALEKEILKPKPSPVADDDDDDDDDSPSSAPTADANPTTPLPLSHPVHARARPSHDFGPIGSPPRSSPHTHSHPLHITPGSPAPSMSLSLLDAPAGYHFTSPFSAPHTQSVFPSPPRAVGGIAASLGAPPAWSTDHGPVPAQVLAASASSLHRELLEDEDLEEFVPGSLSDLLSPSEKSRRMSRTHSGQHPPLHPHARPMLPPGASLLQQQESRHHYSRSVPAPSLLGDIKSIWADAPPNSNGHTATANASHAHTPGLNGHANGTGVGSYLGAPSSFKSSASPFADTAHIAHPSNASAAFLGLHHRYLSSTGSGGGMQRSVSGENRLHAHSNFSGVNGTGISSGGTGVGGNGNGVGIGISVGIGGNGIAGTGGNGVGTGLGGMALSPPRSTFGIGGIGAGRPSFAATHDSHTPSSLLPPHLSPAPHQSLAQQLAHLSHTPSSLSQQTPLAHQPHHAPSHPAQPADAQHPHQQQHPYPQYQTAAALSPSTRALHAHAPGQSLPQGLAAGYSRIHALPPPPNLPSPAFSGGSPGSASAAHGNGTGSLEWLGLGPTAPSAQNAAQNAGGGAEHGGAQQGVPAQAGAGAGGGLESMFSRLSYSAAAARPSHPTARVPSIGGGKAWATGTLSPLSKPALIEAQAGGEHEDDDLFSMDG